jgi:lysophospholipase L1-like esterase
VGLAAFADRLLLRMISGGADMIPLDVSINLRLLLFNLVVTVATALLFGIVPALRGTRIELTDALKDGRGPASGTSLGPVLPAKARATIVACLGSSSTAGKGQAFNWIRELERRPRNQRFRFHNFGVGGDLAYNALQRLPDVLACCPEKVVVLVGGNDVLALVSRKVRRFFRISKHLPSEPSPKWFRENLRGIARRVKAETSAAVALCSLPPIGEAPSSADPVPERTQPAHRRVQRNHQRDRTRREC